MKPNDILKAAQDRLKEATAYEQQNRDRAIDDLGMMTGETQWTPEDRQARALAKRPCLTFNQYPQFVRRVTAQIRGMNPAIEVKAADDIADRDTAEIIEGLVRAIEVDSDATSVYEATAESAAMCSFGHFRVRNIYEDGLTFQQKIVVERVYNQFSVFTDPAARHPTRMDARWRIIVDEVPKETFKQDYPDAACEDFTSEHSPHLAGLWAASDKQSMVVAEYYWIEPETVMIALGPQGEVLREWPKDFKPVRTRKAVVNKVKWAKVSGRDVLEGPSDVPGRYIPVVTVTGEEISLGESTYLSSVGRFAKDAQIAYNLAQTSSVEVVLSQPKAPYMVTAHQIAGYEQYWNVANATNAPYLPYNADPNAPAPMRVPPPVASQGLMTLAQMASEDMKRTTGIFDASLGARSNETSGVAIEARQAEAEASTSIYSDNMVKAVHQCGRIIVSMLPEIYDTKQVVRILGQDGKEKMVTINDVTIEGGAMKPVNDLQIGAYDVVIAVGPSYDTKREKSAAAMIELSRSIPAIGQLAPDLVVRSMDFADAERMADRLAKGLPPGMQEDPDEPTPEQQQAKQAQMQQMQQQAQMQQAMAEAEITTKQAEAVKAQADAEKAKADAIKAQFEARAVGYELGQRMGAGPELDAGQPRVAPNGAQRPKGQN